MGDEVAIAQIFESSIMELTSAHYTLEQRQVWVKRPEPPVQFWTKRCARMNPFVVVVSNEIAGFVELEPNGHIDCTYASPKFAGKGHMSELMRHVIQHAKSKHLKRLFAEVSHTAKPFFARHGFQSVRNNVIEKEGILVENTLMELAL